MTKKRKELPASKITLDIKIGETENTYEISMPNNGQLIDVEVNKITYSNGVNLSQPKTKAAMYAFLFNEMVATFSVMIPQLKEDLNVKSLFDLDPLKTKPLMKVYMDKFLPWWQKWEDIFIDMDEEETGEK